MAPRKFIRDSFGIAFAQYVVRATLMLRTLLAARLLGPSAIGAWNAIQIVMDNGNLLLLGTQQGLDQMVPPRIATGDETGEREVKRAALFSILLFTLLYAAICLVWISVGSSRLRDAWGYAGMGVALICVMATNLANWQTSILRSHGDMRTVGLWMLTQGAVGGVLGIALTPVFGAWGLLLGWGVGCLSSLALTLVRSRRHAPLAPVPSTASLDLLQVGFPMFVFLASSQVMRQLDRLIILRYLGLEMLGYYGLAVMALTFLLYAPDSVTYVLYPRLQKDYAAANRDPEAIRDRVEKVLRASSILVPALAATAFLFANPVVRVLLPKFALGVPALRVLCFGAVGLAFGNFASVVLMTVGRQTLLIPAALLSVVAGAGFDLLAIKLGYGITGVAWATVATYSVSGAMLLVMALAGLGLEPRRVTAMLVRLFLPLAVALALVVSIERWVPWAGNPDMRRRALRLLISVSVFSFAYLLTVKPLTEGLGLRRVLSEINIPFISPLFRRWGGEESTGEEA